MNQHYLQLYADFIVKVGVNVRPRQNFIVRCPVTMPDFAHACVRAGYEAGAKTVVVRWEDDKLTRLQMEMAAESDLCAMKPYELRRRIETDAKGQYRFRTFLPPGYAIKYDGASDDSGTSTALFLEPVPVMAVLILVVLMVQLQNIAQAVMTLLTAPLGMIGVTAGLLITNRPFGFVVMLGIMALFGIIIRNSVILIDQIRQHEQAGEGVREAVLHAAESRLRPILLTAMAAVLAMIPLAGSLFWGSMAIAIGAGLFAATILTLFILPAMYLLWYGRRAGKA